MAQFTISEEVLNKVLSVLAQQPYGSVANIIQEVQQDIKPVEAETKVKAVKEG